MLLCDCRRFWPKSLMGSHAFKRRPNASLEKCHTMCHMVESTPLSLCERHNALNLCSILSRNHRR